MSSTRLPVAVINIPQPPTDNLYKFAAILGLTILVASGVAYVTHVEWVSKHYDQIRIATLHVVDSLDVVYDDFESGRVSREHLADRIQAATGSSLHSTLADIDSADAITAPRAYRGRLALAGMIGGLALFLFGLALWYHRLQKYLDATVRAQAQPAPSEPASESPKKKHRAKASK